MVPFEAYPLPIARSYRRFRNAGETREQHDAAYYLFEVYLKYAASISMAYYLRGEARDHKVNAALKGLARPSTGEWLLDLNGNATWDGCDIDACLGPFGEPGDLPVVGKWM